MKGYVHIYTGNGKGKTTAAFGLALRACGAGLEIFIGQFIKGKAYNELLAASQEEWKEIIKPILADNNIRLAYN